MRQDENLVAIKRISLLEALHAKSFDLENLDGSQVSVVVTDILTPKTILKVPGQGFYVKSESNEVNQERMKRGDLYVRFDIIFPTELTPDQKDGLAEILE
jgi:DnaJ family protein B protein 4